MTEQQQGTQVKTDKYRGIMTFVFPALLFFILFLTGAIVPAETFADGIIRYIKICFWLLIGWAFIYVIYLMIDDKIRGKAKLWFTIFIIAAFGVLYASNVIPDYFRQEQFYRGFGQGYDAGYMDAAELCHDAFNAGIEAELEIIHDPEDYTAEGLYEEWQENAGFWDWSELSGKGLFNLYNSKQQDKKIAK